MHDTHSTTNREPTRFRRGDALEAMRSLSFSEPTWRTSSRSWPSVPLLRAVLSALIGWADGRGIARAVRAHLARQHEVDERTITRALEALEMLGFIERCRVAGWSAIACRIRCHEIEQTGEPSEAEELAMEVAELRRELAAARALAAEANDARELLEGADVIAQAQRSDADDARKISRDATSRPAARVTPVEGSMPGAAGVERYDDAHEDNAHDRDDEGVSRAIWNLVMEGKLAKEDAPRLLDCPKCCECGGRYRIRTCDFVRVKDAVTGLPSLDDVDLQAQRVQASYLDARKVKTGFGPGSFKKPPNGEAWDSAVAICCALEADDEGSFEEASRALCAVWFQRGGRVAEQRWPVNWMKHEHEKLLVDTRAELRRRKMRGAAREASRETAATMPQESPPRCRGICAGGHFKNPVCDDCDAAAAIQAEERAREAERNACKDRAAARERLAVFEADLLRAEGA